jgi:uncharacterized phage protein (TIGR02220 family)
MVMLSLLTYNGNDNIRPSQGTIAEFLGMSRGLVNKTIKSLVDKKMISIDRNKDNKSLQYRIVNMGLVTNKNKACNDTLQACNGNEQGLVTLRDTKINKKKINNENKDTIPYSEIIDYFNQKAGTTYRSSSNNTIKVIKARWNEGYRVVDFKDVIDTMIPQWNNDKMAKYIRPITLFSNKFETYLSKNQVSVKKEEGGYNPYSQ